MTDLRYIPVTQQPYCCVPACLQMVLARRGLPMLSQEEIGKDLGLNVPVEDLRLLPHAFTDEKSTSGWGTRTQEESFSINSFFTKHEYALRENYVDADNFPQKFTLWIEEQIAIGNDILACYDERMVWGAEQSYGHVVVIDSADDDAVTIIDPAYGAPKVRDISPQRILTAMWAHGAPNRGGLWVVESIESD